MSKTKVILIGDSAVGKSCVFERLQGGTFDPDKISTIGGSYACIKIMHENQSFEIGLWDTAGQERYRNVLPIYFQNVSYILLFYSINTPSSFENLQFWYDLSISHAPKKFKLILIGNKCDLDEARTISFQEGEEMRSKLQASTFFEVSALDGTNIHEILSFLAEDIFEFESETNLIKNQNIAQNLEKVSIQNKKRCC
jgi:small GTP-binding protein